MKRVKPPAGDPDPLVAQVIADVNAVSGEYGKPEPYFRQQGIAFDPLVAALHPGTVKAADNCYRAMADDKYGLIPKDHLQVIIGAALLRGVAYGLELAKRRAS